MKKILLLCALFTITMFVTNSFAQDTMGTGDKMTMKGKSSPDASFMKKLSTGGMNEIGLSKTALAQSSNDDVKEYAQKMIDDHTAAGEELKTLAESKNVMLPMVMDAKHQTMNEKLSKMSGTSFDMDYVKAMVSDHEKTVAMLQKEIKSGKDADAKALASKLLPTVQGHLDMAKSMQKSMMDNKSDKKMKDKTMDTKDDGR